MLINLCSTCRDAPRHESHQVPNPRLASVMPNRSAMASRSTALKASSRLKVPNAIIRLAPTSEMPARSIRNPGTRPRATPA